MTITPWLVNRQLNPEASIRLFCLPYAGGGAAIFRLWQQLLPSDIELCPIALPGREHRIRERAHTDLPALLDALVDALWPLLDRPFAIFGHSMGAMIGFELVRTLRRRGGPLPAHLFVSARCAPQVRDRTTISPDLPDEAFLDGIRRLNGTPEEILAHPELLQLLLPMLRADFALIASYQYDATEPPLDCPISVFGGIQDTEITHAELDAWRAHTTQLCMLRMFPGNHFFLQTARAQLLRAIIDDLRLRRR
ncbi:MAG TPA: alpha/beta fold hydrolase [Roseiflexaceae bacterium]|nr:alpha/beta fold hydrolase [Roseiflexaceae bacterium]